MRRNPLRGRQPVYVVVVAVVSGLLAATAGLRPTGASPIDVLLVAGSAGAVTWAAASAPWWMLAAMAVLAAGTAPSAVLAGVGLATVVLASVIGGGRLNLPWLRSLVVLVAIQVLARCEVGAFQGWSALFSCVALAVVFVWGVLRRPRATRRRVWQVLGGVGVFAVLAMLGFALAGLVARGPLEAGNRQARTGLDALNRGDMVAAEAAFRSSARSFRKADDALGAVWAQGARLVPVAAQHRESVAELTGGAADAMSQAASALAEVDPEALRVIDGRIDVAAVRALEAPFTQLLSAIEDLQATVDGARSPWLAGPLTTRLDDLEGELVDNRVRADNALLAVQVAPRMLGADRPRRYFVAFTTPAEARGLGGFMGNWAEITIVGGQIEMSGFGRHSDLSEAGDQVSRRLTGMDEFLERWGEFGFSNYAGGTAGPVVWTNVTMAPDFPTTAQVISQLYPQSGGRPVDGVFMLDPQAMAALMSFTGPIAVDGIEQQLTAENVVQYIIKDQYLLPDNAQRIDLLETIARSTVDRLLAGALPPPAELGRTFAPLAAQGRLMAWSADPEEQELLTRVRMAGVFPQLNGGDGVAVTVDNGSGNKIDAYLEMKVDHVVTNQSADGARESTVTVTLTNTAPAGGLPKYVIGNLVGLPDGTNRTWLSVYTALPMVGVEVDGVADGMETGQVFGWNVASRFVDVPPGGTVTLVLTTQGMLVNPGQPVTTRIQALNIEPQFTSVNTVPID